MGSRSQSQPVLRGFVVFEGIDGAGTTTQARRLVDSLSARGVAAEFTCEPTDLETGRLIRRFLASGATVDPMTLAYLFAADRNEHLTAPTTGIVARVAEGQVVVCDRYLFSSLAYQGEFADFGRVCDLNAVFPLPEHLFFIDTPVTEAQRRLADRLSTEEIERLDVQRRVAERYREVLAVYADSAMTVHLLDGVRPVDELARTVAEAVTPTARTS